MEVNICFGDMKFLPPQELVGWVMSGGVKAKAGCPELSGQIPKEKHIVMRRATH